MSRSETTTAKADAIKARNESLTDRAYKELEELVVTLRLAPGSVLSENALAGELGIGRTPIREALQRLAREGLVVILPRKGILVSEINPRKQLLVLEVRRELERLVARSGALRRSEDLHLRPARPHSLRPVRRRPPGCTGERSGACSVGSSCGSFL